MRINKLSALIGAALLSAPALSHAGNAGGSADTLGGMGKFSLGLEAQRDFARDLRHKDGNVHTTELGIDFHDSYPMLDDSIGNAELDSRRLMLQATFGILPNLDGFVSVGTQSSDLEYRLSEPGFSAHDYELDGDGDSAWGVGLRAKLWESAGGTRLLGTLQYHVHEGDADAGVNGMDLAAYASGDLTSAGATDVSLRADADNRIESLSLAFLVAKPMGDWTPYLGARYQTLDIDNDISVQGTESGDTPYSQRISQNFKSDEEAGVFVGADFAFNNQLHINAETTFGDQASGSLSATWRF